MSQKNQRDIRKNALVCIIAISTYCRGSKFADIDTIVEGAIKSYKETLGGMYNYDIVSTSDFNEYKTVRGQRNGIEVKNEDTLRNFIRNKCVSKFNHAESDNKRKYDALFVAIIGHGDVTGLFLSDKGTKMKYNDIKYEFTSYNSLRAVPKVYCIDSCRYLPSSSQQLGPETLEPDIGKFGITITPNVRGKIVEYDAVCKYLMNEFKKNINDNLRRQNKLLSLGEMCHSAYNNLNNNDDQHILIIDDLDLSVLNVRFLPKNCQINAKDIIIDEQTDFKQKYEKMVTVKKEIINIKNSSGSKLQQINRIVNDYISPNNTNVIYIEEHSDSIDILEKIKNLISEHDNLKKMIISIQNNNKLILQQHNQTHNYIINKNNNIIRITQRIESLCDEYKSKYETEQQTCHELKQELKLLKDKYTSINNSNMNQSHCGHNLSAENDHSILHPIPRDNNINEIENGYGNNKPPMKKRKLVRNASPSSVKKGKHKRKKKKKKLLSKKVHYISADSSNTQIDNRHSIEEQPPSYNQHKSSNHNNGRRNINKPSSSPNLIYSDDSGHDDSGHDDSDISIHSLQSCQNLNLDNTNNKQIESDDIETDNKKKNNGHSSKATTNSNKYKRKKPKKKLNTPMILSDDDGTINNNKLKSSARIAKISNRNSKSSKKKTVIRNKSKNTKKDNGNPNDNNNFQNSYYESINCHLCDKHFDEIDEYTAHLKNFKHYGKFLHYFKNKWNEQDRINALDWIKGDILTTFVQAHLIDNQNNWSEIKFVKQHAQSLNIKACKNKTDLRKCPTNTNFTYSRHIHLLITCMDHGEDDDNELAKTIYDHMIICRTNKLTGHWIYPQDKNTFRKYFKHNVQGSSNSMQKCHCLR
eukprot:8681_1